MGSTSPSPAAQILPPGGSYHAPQQPVRKPRPSWAVAPATYVLVAINCLVFLVMVANGVSLGNPTTSQLMHWGADNAGSVLILSQWWRIVTAMFVHVGLIHLATNMWCLWNLGLLAEPLLGSAGVFAAYLLTGAAGNLLSTLYNWNQCHADWEQYHQAWLNHLIAAGSFDPASRFSPGAGASGAVFGIAGVLIVLLKSNRLPVPPAELKKLRKSVIYFAAINLIIGFSIDFGPLVARSGIVVDNSAHLGGVLCGLLFAVPLVPRFGSPRPLFLTRLRFSIAMVLLALTLFAFYLTKLPK